MLAHGATQYFPLNEAGGSTAFNAMDAGSNGKYLGAVRFGAAGPLLDEPSTAIALPGGTASVGVLLAGPNATIGKSFTFQTWVNAMPSSTYLTIWGADGKRRLMVSNSGLVYSNFNGNFFSKTRLTRNQWHDVVFVYNASTSAESYYIDGKLDSTAALAHSYAAFAGSYYLGQYDTGRYYKWHGSLAQHAFYPAALSASQVAALHAAAGYGTAPNPAPTTTATALPTSPPTGTPAPTPTATATPSGAVVTIPYWQSSFTYAGKTYTYKMVGSNPMTLGTSTTIGVEIVPIQLVFSDGTTLDATSAAATMPKSPLFTSASYASGNTQYGDAFMRSEFWKYAANENYHVLLGAPVMEPTIQLTVPAADGYTSAGSNGQRTGYLTYAWFVQTMEPQIIQQLNIDPRTLTIFATYGTKVLEPPDIVATRATIHRFR